MYIPRALWIGLVVLFLTACPDDEAGSDPGDAAGSDMGSDVSPDLGEDVEDDTDAGGCTPGDTTCACLDDDTCSDPSDECSGGVCIPRTDCDGELGCACNDDGTCDDGYDCENGTCGIGNGLSLRLTGGDARACDFLIESTGRLVQDVVFPAGVRGRMRTRNERTAIALVRTSDTALDGVVATVVFEGAAEAESDEILSLDSSCFGRLGAADDAVTAAAE